MLAGPTVHDPVNQVISSEELRSLVGCISTALSELESRVLSLYLDGRSYEEIGERLAATRKTVDNALQRVKRKVGAHLRRAGGPRLSRAAQRAISGAGPQRAGERDLVGLAGEALRDGLGSRPALQREVERLGRRAGGRGELARAAFERQPVADPNMRLAASSPRHPQSAAARRRQLVAPESPERHEQVIARAAVKPR